MEALPSGHLFLKLDQRPVSHIDHTIVNQFEIDYSCSCPGTYAEVRESFFSPKIYSVHISRNQPV